MFRIYVSIRSWLEAISHTSRHGRSLSHPRHNTGVETDPPRQAQRKLVEITELIGTVGEPRRTGHNAHHAWL